MPRPTDYSAAFSAEAAEQLLALRRRRQRALLDCVGELSRDPFRRGDYVIVDADGHQIEHRFMDDFLIAYWTDHAIRRVFVIEFDDLD